MIFVEGETPSSDDHELEDQNCGRSPTRWTATVTCKRVINCSIQKGSHLSNSGHILMMMMIMVNIVQSVTRNTKKLCNSLLDVIIQKYHHIDQIKYV